MQYIIVHRATCVRPSRPRTFRSEEIGLTRNGITAAMPANESLIGTRCTFTASDGVPWSVGEFVESTSGAADDRYLVFECDGAMRRVRHFPFDWRELGTDALLALSWAR